MTPASEISLVQPAPTSEIDTNSKQARAAIKHCCAAWKREYEANLEGTRRNSTDKIFAAHSAGPAYCKAMPPLAGYDNIRSFIACATYGILIDAIPAQKGSQLLYAAQVALATLHSEPKPRKNL